VRNSDWSGRVKSPPPPQMRCESNHRHPQTGFDQHPGEGVLRAIRVTGQVCSRGASPTTDATTRPGQPTIDAASKWLHNDRDCSENSRTTARAIVQVLGCQTASGARSGGKVVAGELRKLRWPP